jgi:hypothetical protein
MRSGQFLDESIRIFGFDRSVWLPPSTKVAEKHIRDEQHREQRTASDGKVPKERHMHGLR